MLPDSAKPVLSPSKGFIRATNLKTPCKNASVKKGDQSVAFFVAAKRLIVNPVRR